MFNLTCYFLLGMIWGSSFPLMKIITPYFGASWMIAVRTLVGALFVSLILIAKFPKISLKNNLTKLFIISTCKLVLPFLLIAKASTLIPAATSAVLFSTGPLWSAFLTIVLGNKKTTKTKILGIILGFTGVVILVLGLKNNQTHADLDIYSMLLPLLAAFIYASGGVYAHNISKSIRMSPTGVLLSSLWIASIIGILFPFIATNKNIPSFNAVQPVWPHIMILGCFGTGFGNLLYFRLLKAWDAVSAMSVIFIVPVFSMVWCRIMLNETITLNMLMCCVLIITGSLLVVSKSK